ncbi:MAG: 4-hydroxythreonine-4-phosphate dehydrogenase PdxA, partial [Rhodospirillales bacterium]|nr:4-hydroxythreonine-4-phosphate dehydrogenase PdxA [Rhodospirillales bacterium]
AMYHDQGHIPVKVAAPIASAAMTVGTPVLFTTVGHGSAHDIAGQGIADAGAFLGAAMILSTQFKN